MKIVLTGSTLLILSVISSLVFSEDPPAKLKLRDSSAPTTAQRGGDKDTTTGMELVFVKGGCYKMGSTAAAGARFGKSGARTAGKSRTGTGGEGG